MSLFTTRRPTFRTKEAASRLLGENPASWPNEILALLYEQHSYLGRYKVDLHVGSKDDSSGYVHGHFTVSALTNPADPPGAVGAFNNWGTDSTNQLSANGGQEVTPAEPQGPSVQIPVIAVKRKLFAFDVMTDQNGTFMPLSESRVDGIMFSTAPMENTTTTASDGSVGGQFTPPIMRTFGTGVTYEKQSSLLEAVCRQVPDRVKQAYLEATLGGEDGAELRWAVQNNPAFRRAVGVIYHTKEAASSTPLMRPTSVVLEKLGSAVAIHTANGAAYEPVTRVVARHELHTLPQDLLSQAQRTGMGVWSEEVPYQEDATEFDVVKTAGLYAVLSGDEILEHTVVPEVYRVDGTRMRHKLAFGVGTYTTQADIAGAYLGPAEFDVGVPLGFGAFVAPDGSAATEPLTVASSVSRGGRVAYLVENGRQVEKVAHLVRPVGDGTRLAIPESWRFQPLGGRKEVAEEPHRAKTAAAMEDVSHAVDVLHDGATYHFRGGGGVDLLPEQQRQWVKEAQAALLLGALGLGAEETRQKLAEAEKRGRARVYCGRSVTPMAARKEAVRAKVAAFRAQHAIQPLFLVKEAAALAGPDAADTVLALGFITPDNLATYVEYLPELEQAAQRLAEITIAARLGAPQIQESAAARAMAGIDKVVEALQQLQLQLQTPETPG